MYRVKIKNFSGFDFKKAYLQKLRQPTQKELFILSKYVQLTNKIFKLNKLNYIRTIPWLFLVSKNGLEMNMPYTLSNYIVINETQLFNLNRFEQINRNFINTLIHEKIHIVQRINQAKFNIFYRQHYTFLDKKIDIKDVPLQYKKIYMSNPDSNKDFWLYRINSNIYYPLLVKKGNRVKSIAVTKNRKIDLDYFKRKLNYNNHVSFYHPNEIFACTVTDMILENSIPQKYFKLLNNI
jgi:hypothetical protein